MPELAQRISPARQRRQHHGQHRQRAHAGDKRCRARQPSPALVMGLTDLMLDCRLYHAAVYDHFCQDCQSATLPHPLGHPKAGSLVGALILDHQTVLGQTAGGDNLNHAFQLKRRDN